MSTRAERDAKQAEYIGDALSWLGRMLIRLWFVLLIWNHFGSFYGWMSVASIMLILGFIGSGALTARYVFLKKTRP